MSKRKYTVKLTKVEKELIKSGLEVLGRNDLIENFDELGHVYFYKSVWEYYDLIYDLGTVSNNLYQGLMEGFDITYDNARRWVKNDKEILDFYRLGLRSNLKPLYKIKDNLINDFKGTGVKTLYKIGTDDDGKSLYANVTIDIKLIESHIDKIKNEIYKTEGSNDMLSDMIEGVLNEEEE